MQKKKSNKNILLVGLSIIILLFVFWAALQMWGDSSNEAPGITVPEGFVIEEAVKPGLIKYPMFAVFDDQGNLFVMESSGHTDGTDEILEAPNF